MNNVAHSGTQTPKVELDGHPEGDAAVKASRLFDNRDPGNLVSGLGFLTDRHPTILVLAGEASGDLHAAKLVAELKARIPAARFLGMGGSGMRAQGVELLAELDTLAVMGLSEVLSRIPHFWKLHKKVVAAIDSEAPDLVILVDYSGFNLKIARAAHDRGCAVLYYIAPKIWAWNERRAQTLAAVTHRVAAILPFEVNRLKEHGVNVEYVGHPLLDHSVDIASREESFRSWGLDPQRPLLGILPGSREQEIERHLRTFSASAQVVVERRPDVQVLISQAPGLDDSMDALVAFAMASLAICTWFALSIAIFVAAGAGGRNGSLHFYEPLTQIIAFTMFLFIFGGFWPLLTLLFWDMIMVSGSPYLALAALLLSLAFLLGLLTLNIKFFIREMPLELYHMPRWLLAMIRCQVPWLGSQLRDTALEPRAKRRAAELRQLAGLAPEVAV